MSIDNATPEQWNQVNHDSIKRIDSIQRMTDIIRANDDLTPDELAVLLHQSGYGKLPANLLEQAG